MRMSHSEWDGAVSRAVKALARTGRPDASSWQRARQAVLEAAGHLRAEAAQNSPPILLDGIKQLRGVTQGPGLTSYVKPDALLIPTAHGFTLRLRAGMHWYRQRFRTAHEIGHTFFYDLNKTPPTRLISYAMSFSLQEEGICHAFASELLLPRDLLLQEVMPQDADGALPFVLYLAQRYCVSPEVVARRVISQLGALDTAIAIFKEADASGSGKAASVRWYKGRTLKSYLRKAERAALLDTLSTIQNGPPYASLGGLPQQHPVIASLRWSASPSGLSFVALLSLKR